MYLERHGPLLFMCMALCSRSAIERLFGISLAIANCPMYHLNFSPVLWFFPDIIQLPNGLFCLCAYGKDRCIVYLLSPCHFASASSFLGRPNLVLLLSSFAWKVQRRM